MKTRFKEFAPNYFGVDTYIFPLNTAYDGWLKQKKEILPKITYSVKLTPNTLVDVCVNEHLPILRPKSDLTENEFIEMAKFALNIHPNDSVGAIEYEHEWYAFIIDEGTRHLEEEEQLTEADSADSENVFCLFKRDFNMAYGMESDSMGFINFETVVKMVNYLRSISIDCDGLIKSGQAVDKTKMVI